jgi:gas vesicle protein
MSMINDTVSSAKNAMDAAKEGTEKVAHSARHTIMDGVRMTADLVSMLRGLQVDDVLHRVGLARQRGPLDTLALFGGGVLVGTGIGFFFAPKSGAETRRALFGWLRGAEHDAERLAGKVQQEVKNDVKAGEKLVEDLAGKAKDKITSAEHAIEDMAGKAKTTAIGAEKDIENKAKSALGTTDYENKGLRGPNEQLGNGNHRPITPQRQ